MNRVVGLCSAAAVILAALPAAADWPMALHDPQRTAATSGKGNLTAPVPTWRYRTGGALYFTQAMAADADGDGKPELFFVRGSSAVARRLDDTLLWASPSMGVSTIQALADLDGDGKPELVVGVGTNQTAVFDALTGALDWLEPATDIGFAGTRLVGDLTGDGLPELLVQDCGCCAVMGTIPGAVYSFKGNAKTPTLLWTLPYAGCGGGNSTTLLDMDGDGLLEVLMFSGTTLDLLDGPTGKKRASLTYGTNLATAQCEPAKLLPGAGQQAVCVYSNGTPDNTGHRVLAVGYTSSPTPALQVLWDQLVPGMDGNLAVKPGLVADLDGDGKMEITFASQLDLMTAATIVLDGATGAQLGILPGHALLGTAPIQAGTPLILTAESNGFAAWGFKRGATPAIFPAWQVPGQSPLVFRDFALSTRCYQNAGLLVTDVASPGGVDLVTQSTVDGSISVLDSTQGAPVTVASAPAPPNTALLWSAPVTVQGQSGFVTGWSDGVFRTETLGNGGLTAIDPPGARFDGYYSTSFWRALAYTPVVAALEGGGAQAVLVADASGTLHRLDATKADANTPPVEVWALPNTQSPIVVPNLEGGASGIVVVQRKPGNPSPPEQQIVALAPDATVLWSAPLAGTVYADLVTGNFDGDGVPDVVVQWGATAEANASVHTTVFSGIGGTKLLDGTSFPAETPTGPAVSDWNGDGIDDIFFAYHGVHVLSGKDGAEISPPPAEKTVSSATMVADVNKDSAPEVVLEGGYARATVLSHDLKSVLFASTETQSTTLYGALARCPGGARLVEGTYFYHTARLRLTDLSAPTVGKETDMFLAGGQKFPDEASATAAGVFQGVLSAVSIHEDLSGKGHPSALVGSTDGWLYAVDPCSGDLEYAVNFKDAVGSVVFGDTDGDGLDEILVEVADGYLYDLKQKSPTPGTGGSGGTGGAGVGGAGSMGDDDLINGRATCTCGIPSSNDDAARGLTLVGGIALLTTRRRRRAYRA